MTICIQCAMEAMVAGKPYTPTPEEPEVHRERLHHDLHATQVRRAQLEAILKHRLAAGIPFALGMNPAAGTDGDTDAE